MMPREVNYKTQEKHQIMQNKTLPCFIVDLSEKKVAAEISKRFGWVSARDIYFNRIVIKINLSCATRRNLLRDKDAIYRDCVHDKPDSFVEAAQALLDEDAIKVTTHSQFAN